MSDVVLVEHQGAVAIVTLNRPESLNAMSPQLLNDLSAAGQALADDAAVRCVVITGAGRAFSAGGDVKAMAEGATASTGGGAGGGLLGRVDALRQQEEISRLLYEMPKPTIAAVNGVAAGAGLSLALAADLRIASEHARFTTAFAKIGFSGDFGGTWLLQRLVGPAKAKELYFMSEIFDAQEAMRLGLLTKLVPHDQLMAETMALANRLAAGPTIALGRIKDNIAHGATSTLSDSLTHEAENMIASGLTEDHRNAAIAFVQKREPQFTGR